MNNRDCCCLRGPRGFTGATGPQGSRGEQGLPGKRGPRGCEGAEGPQGPTGLQGPQGPEGLQGPTGLQGLQGAQGLQGTDGQTPYIGTNGNWWIGTTDTGINAVGPNVAGNYEGLINDSGHAQDTLIWFPNGGLIQRGMSIDTTKTLITIDSTQYYRVTFMGYLYATSGNPKIAIQRNQMYDLNNFPVSPTQGGLTVLDVVYPFLAGDTISLIVRDGDVAYWENTTNELTSFLTIVGWGQGTQPII